MAKYKIQVTNQSGLKQAYFLLFETPTVSNVTSTVFPTIYQQSAVISSGGLVEMEVNNAPFAICGTSPGTPLGAGVAININEAQPLVIAAADQRGPKLFVTVRDQAAVFEDVTGTTSAPMAIQTDLVQFEATAHGFCGLGGETPNRAVFPTCVWEVTSSTQYDVTPAPIFFVGAGQRDVGTIPEDLSSHTLALIDFTHSDSRLCSVTHNGDGSFTVTPPDQRV